jgi:sugar lactone lactonase YvrE
VRGVVVVLGSVMGAWMGGGGSGFDRPWELGFPSGLAMAPSGRAVTVADRSGHRVYDVDLATGALTLRAGTGEPGFSGDRGPAKAAQLRNPEWVAYDSRGDLLIADRGNSRIRRVDAETGVIETVVGSGEVGRTGDGGPAVQAGLTHPYGIVVTRQDDLLVFDTDADVIRRVDAHSGLITTVVGDGRRRYAGDGVPGPSASLARPHNGVLTEEGLLVFGDSFNQRIRVWDPGTGIVETLAGTGEQGAPVVGALAQESPFMFFGAMLEEPDGSIVFTSLDNRILRVRAATGRVEVVAGTGAFGSSGDGGPATRARLRLPYGLARTHSGDLIVAEAEAGRIRRIDATTATITTLAGGG